MTLSFLGHHPQPAFGPGHDGADPGLLALIAVALVLAVWALAAGWRARRRHRP